MWHGHYRLTQQTPWQRADYGMDGSGESSILGKKKSRNQTNKVWDCENQAELPHMLSLYCTPNLSEIYSKKCTFALPPPFLVEVLVFLYLGTEDTLSINLYGFPAVLYYLCSSEIPWLVPAFPQANFPCSDFYSKWPQHFWKAKMIQLIFLFSGQGFSCHLENSFVWLDIHAHRSTQSFASRQDMFCLHSKLVQQPWKCNHKALSDK